MSVPAALVDEKTEHAMHKPRVTHIHPLRDALHGLEEGRSFGTLEAWHRLVAVALRRQGVIRTPVDELVDEVQGELFVRLLALREAGAPAWRALLALDEAALRSRLRRMAVRAAMDLDPERGRKRALAQLVSRILQAGVPEADSPPVALRQGGRLHRPSVAAAVAWALARPDHPRRRPYPIACWLLRAYEPVSSYEEESPLDLLEPEDAAGRAERVEHADKVASRLQARLAPEEARVLALQLQGETLEEIATDLGCRRTKAQGLAARARETAADVVAELEAEWVAA